MQRFCVYCLSEARRKIINETIQSLLGTDARLSEGESGRRGERRRRTTVLALMQWPMVEVAAREFNMSQAQLRRSFHADARHTMACRVGKHTSLELDARAHAKKVGGAVTMSLKLVRRAISRFPFFPYRPFIFIFQFVSYFAVPIDGRSEACHTLSGDIHGSFLAYALLKTTSHSTKRPPFMRFIFIATLTFILIQNRHTAACADRYCRRFGLGKRVNVSPSSFSVWA